MSVKEVEVFIFGGEEYAPRDPTKAPLTHNHASNAINAMTGYSKAASAAAIAETDTLNAAMGKLEKAIEGAVSSGEVRGYARKTATSGSDTASTSGWYKVAEATVTGYNNCHGIFAVYNTYSKHTQFGIFKISIRCNNESTIYINDFTWVVRENGWTYDYICYVVSGNTVSLYVYQDNTQYGRIMAELLSESSTVSNTGAWVMTNSTAPTGGTAMSGKTYPVDCRCFSAGKKTISTASAKSVTVTVKGTFFKSSTLYYTAGLLRFHFNTAKTDSTSYKYGDYTYGSYNVSGNDGWIAPNSNSVTTLPQITTSIDSTSDTAKKQERTVTFTIALSSMSYVTVEYDPQIYTVS